MATQKYRSRLDTTVGENSGTTRPVHPARPELPVKAGAENKTPPPTKPFDPTARDKTWGRQGYGANGSAFPSSLPPGTATPKGAVDAQAPVDAVLEGLQHGGVRALDKQDDWQTLDLTNKHDNPHGPSPIHPDMTGARPGGTVPAKCGEVK